MRTNLEVFKKSKELGEKGEQSQTSTPKKELQELTITEEQESEGEEHSEKGDISVDIMDESAVAEEEQRVYKVQGKEETKALRIK